MTDAVAFMGGTFDPIHNGHLRTALEIRELLALREVRLVPCHRPPHRETPGCSSQHRLRMVELAVTDEPGLRVDGRELRSPEPSYTVATLKSLRAELGDERPLIMVLGMDSFLGLPTWHRWQELITLAHMLVVQRPGWRFADNEPMARWVRDYQVTRPEALLEAPGGRVLIHGLTPLGISATQVRERIAAGGSPRFLIPDAVWNYIREQGLYNVKF
ncbi:nicotinate-nucleotide adenylyltransferase [Motiliproteus sp. SC1-56]|uniref:nicotinate-nucleotide adenylyltransferase n=1 Tax=Motiliproteus sp. SC1-56 TaxID=2799565 RepID=UPI001A8F75DE|nr:nicotinate-nucleotide adenylyltransferase [Motiliproteus sp. SC1-56]